MLGTYYLLKGFSVSTGLAWATGRHRFPLLYQDGGWQPAAYVLVLRLGPSFACWAGLFLTPSASLFLQRVGEVDRTPRCSQGPWSLHLRHISK